MTDIGGGLFGADALKEDLLTAIADRAFIGEDALPRSEQAFSVQRQRARARLPAVREAMVRLVWDIAGACHPLLARLSVSGATRGATAKKGTMGEIHAQLHAQLRELVYPGFLNRTRWDRLQHLPRYLKAMALRLDKYPGNPERDRRHAADIAGLWKQYEQRRDRHGQAGFSDPALAEFRWQIEELRVSLFAQELKTPSPVSVKRLQKLWESVGA